MPEKFPPAEAPIHFHLSDAELADDHIVRAVAVEIDDLHERGRRRAPR
jgi:hypothetical protein